MANDQRLLELPKSNHQFWAQAEKYSQELGKQPKCEHDFVHRLGREVECKKCHIGFYLVPNSYVLNGHLYINDQLAI